MTEGRGKAEWAEVLDDMQASIERCLQQAPQPEESPHCDNAAVRLPLEALDRRMTELQESLQRAERSAAETDALLQGEAETVRLWNEAIKRLREKLANWVAQAG